MLLSFLIFATWTLVGQQTNVKPAYRLYRVDATVVGTDTTTIDAITGIQYGWWAAYARARESDSVGLTFQYAVSPVDSFWAINTWTTISSHTDTLFKPAQLYPVTLMLMKTRVVGGVSNDKSAGTKFTAYLCHWEL